MNTCHRKTSYDVCVCVFFNLILFYQGKLILNVTAAFSKCFERLG